MGVESIVLALSTLATIPSLIAVVFIWRRRRYGSLFWVVLGAGALGWFAAQFPKSITFLAISPILGIPLDAPREELMRNLGVLVTGAILAGFFEELFKFIGILAFKKKIRTPNDGICYGLGAGFGAGILEAVLIGISAYYTVISQAEPMIVDLNLLLGPIERISASFLHAALTAILAYLFFSKKAYFGFLTVSGYHTFIDFFAPWLLASKVMDNIWVLEGLIAISVFVLYLPIFHVYREQKTVNSRGNMTQVMEVRFVKLMENIKSYAWKQFLENKVL